MALFNWLWGFKLIHVQCTSVTAFNKKNNNSLTIHSSQLDVPHSLQNLPHNLSNFFEALQPHNQWALPHSVHLETNLQLKTNLQAIKVYRFIVYMYVNMT